MVRLGHDVKAIKRKKKKNSEQPGSWVGPLMFLGNIKKIFFAFYNSKR